MTSEWASATTANCESFVSLPYEEKDPSSVLDTVHMYASACKPMCCAQAALTRDIQDTMQAWKQQLQGCVLIYVHAPSANAAPLFHGEAPPLNRGDRRVRSVPFTTRRPTFSETKRVAQMLLTLTAAEAPVMPPAPSPGRYKRAIPGMYQNQALCADSAHPDRQVF